MSKSTTIAYQFFVICKGIHAIINLYWYQLRDTSCKPEYYCDSALGLWNSYGRAPFNSDITNHTLCIIPGDL